MSATKTKTKTKPAPPDFRARATQFKLIGDPTRLAILDMLYAEEMHVGAICDRLEVSQPAVSHHLAIMRMGRLVEIRRAGKQNVYSLTESGRALAAVASTI